MISQFKVSTTCKAQKFSKTVVRDGVRVEGNIRGMNVRKPYIWDTQCNKSSTSSNRNTHLYTRGIVQRTQETFNVKERGQSV